MRYRNHSFPELKKACSNLSGKEFETVKKANGFMQSHSEDSEGKAHQLNTAFILAKIGLDSITVSSALVHEILFEEPDKKSEMVKALGREITGIGEEVARLKSIKNQNYGKMPNSRLMRVIMGVAKDFRSLFIELASQLDKIRRLEKRAEEKRKELAELVGHVYAPIAHKLGLYELEWEMRDLALKYFKPGEYNKIKGLVGKKRAEREKIVKRMEKNISGILESEGINAIISGRVKSFNSIYKKMTEQGKKFGEIEDLYGIRVICDSVENCYRAMGLIHINYPPLREYDDYIANPKENNYQSIHTCFGWNGEKIEAQIRTWEMHRNAEEGLAAHWRYKRLESDKKFDKRLNWIKQFVEWQRKVKKTSETMRSLKLDFGKREIFVLTPKKEIIALPEGSTALDFAYAIHSDLGSKCKSVIVNSKISPLSKVLESGDIVTVNAAKKKQCKPAWLNIVKTEKAKSRIRKELGIKRRAVKKFRVRERETIGALKKTAIAKCCNPLPGDEIVGYRTTKRKITIHSRDCPLQEVLPEGRKIEMDWGAERKKSYSARLMVKAFERAGMLIDLLSELEKQGVSINSTETKSEKGDTIKCVFDIELKNAEHFERVRRGILSIPAVLEVGR